MPSRNSIKLYVENGIYHVYNRGVEKRVVFEDEQDYGVFLRNLKEILTPLPSFIPKTMVNINLVSFEVTKKPLKNYFGQIELMSYCLMPNHFHLLIKQINKDSLQGFMRALMTRYSMYFNKRNDRVGSLFQGRYKAVLVETEEYLLHLSRYIHLNPLELGMDIETAHSSYRDFIGKRNTLWLKPDCILDYYRNGSPDFIQKTTYKDFVEKEANNKQLPKDLILDT